jgi:phosphoribosylformimino-5-aminoimidazole carboxamide ribotide isomerase
MSQPKTRPVIGGKPREGENGASQAVLGVMTSFAIIPVLDLKGGHVVRARAGDRANYRPISTPLAAGSEPNQVLAGLLGLAAFSTIYVADLDAIGRTGSHRREIARLRDAAHLSVWVDGGFASARDARWATEDRLVPVFGSETLAGIEETKEIIETLGPDGFVLSLDYRGGRLMGPAEIEHRREFWPNRIILMTLDRVGMNEGPATSELEGLALTARPRKIFAAGGVRSEKDLDDLAKAGVAGALVASALHDGRLTASVIARFLG